MERHADLFPGLSGDSRSSVIGNVADATEGRGQGGVTNIKHTPRVGECEQCLACLSPKPIPLRVALV